MLSKRTAGRHLEDGVGCWQQAQQVSHHEGVPRLVQGDALMLWL
jgi:hypothetical protein